MKLYSFFRSGTSHRLRIALKLKGLTPDYLPVDLRVDEQAEAPTLQPRGAQGGVLTLHPGEIDRSGRFHVLSYQVAN